jgi:hypothetical protein
LDFHDSKRLHNDITARKEDDSEAAIQEFQDVVDTEEEKGDWWVYSQ